MNLWVVVSHVGLWSLLVAQTVLILVLFRQVGLLHLQGRGGAEVVEVKAKIIEGDLLPALNLPDMDNATNQIRIPSDRDGDFLLVVMSPNCAACEAVTPNIRRLSEETGTVGVVMMGELKACKEFRRANELHAVLVAHGGDQLREQYGLRALPYAFLVDRSGTVKLSVPATETNLKTIDRQWSPSPFAAGSKEVYDEQERIAVGSNRG